MASNYDTTRSGAHMLQAAPEQACRAVEASSVLGNLTHAAEQAEALAKRLVERLSCVVGHYETATKGLPVGPTPGAPLFSAIDREQKRIMSAIDDINSLIDRLEL
jgi:hypothetical protein